MVAIEQDKNHCRTRGEEQQTILGKGIGMKTAPAIFNSDLGHVSGGAEGLVRTQYLILSGLVVTIQRSEINVARSQVDVLVFVIGSEDAVNHKSSKGEHQRRQASRMLSELKGHQ